MFDYMQVITYFDGIRGVKLKHSRMSAKNKESSDYKGRRNGLNVLHLRKFNFLQTI